MALTVLLTQRPRGSKLLAGTDSVKETKHGRWIEIQRTTTDPSVPAVLGHRTTTADGGDRATRHVPGDLRAPWMHGFCLDDQGD